jgi:acetyltransferase
MANSVYQMTDMANALVHIPRMHPDCRIAVITLSGGAGILACDALEREGLPVADLSAETRERLKKIFPPWMPPANPIDLFPAMAMRGRMAAFKGALDAVMADDALDALVIHIVAGLEDATMDLEELKQMADACGKTIVFWLMGIKQEKEKFARDARQAGFTVYSDVTEIARCLGGISLYNAYKNRGLTGSVQEISFDPGLALPPLCTVPGVLDEFDSKQLLTQWKIPVVNEKIV